MADDVPPLEDLTEMITRLSPLSSKNTSLSKEYLEVSENESRERKIFDLLEISSSKKNVRKEGFKTEKTTFCGFKKGFLLSDNKISKRDYVEKKEIKGKNVLAEVQNAMTSNIPTIFNSTEWVTEDLLEKIRSHPNLSKQFFDPQFGELIAQFHKNPNKIMTMCQSNAEMHHFIQEFSAIMSNHFISLAEEEKKRKTFKEQKYEGGDDDKVKSILSDPEMVSILQSRDIQFLFTCLKSDPTKAEKLLKSADSVTRYKIQKLVDAGLLRMS